MQSFSSRIWTRVAMSISYDENHYTMGTSTGVASSNSISHNWVLFLYCYSPGYDYQNQNRQPREFNKEHSSKFHVGSQLRQMPEEGQRTYWPKRCGNNNKDENSPKKLNDKNHQASSQKFRQLASSIIKYKWFLNRSI